MSEETGWDFDTEIDQIDNNSFDDDIFDVRGEYQDPEGINLVTELASEHENLKANMLSSDDTFFYHPSAEEVLRYLHDWAWNTLNKSGYRMVVIYLWGERYTGKSTTLRQFKTLVYNILKKRIDEFKDTNRAIPMDLLSDFKNVKKSIIYFELPTGMDSDKRLFYTILVNKFGMKPIKTVYNSRTAFDFVRKLMEICLIYKIKVIMIDEFDRLENYGYAEKILNHLHYLSNGENWEDVYVYLKSKGMIREKPAFTRFILCGINHQIPLLDMVNWNDDRITEIKLDVLSDEDLIKLLSKVVRYYQKKYGMVDWNLFDYDINGNPIGYDKNEIDLLREYSESKAGKLLEMIKRAGVMAIKNGDLSIKEEYYNFALLKTSYQPNIETNISNKVTCTKCGEKYTKRGISKHERNCKS